ncbi:histidinol dehydrogenase, partial [Mycobacterium sp. 1423905.2]|uniref:histidinol dehydrogenase n=1 Tax=Mycobacterium sp. 1423905.2 TaxID=1856859 RepID=UPI00352BC094
MLTRIDLRGAQLTAARLRAALPRGGADVESVLPTVRPIVQAVAERGAEAALEYGESFDGIRPDSVRVPDAALADALAGLDRGVRDALQVMIERTRAVHADQRRTDVTTTLDGYTALPPGTYSPTRCTGTHRSVTVAPGPSVVVTSVRRWSACTARVRSIITCNA